MMKTKRADSMGAQGVLVVTPYYNMPLQSGLIAHYEKVAGQTSLPLILYNIPSRSACSLELKSVQILAQIENIVGIKEASGNMRFLKQLKKTCPKDFSLFGGNDELYPEFLNQGGHGGISATSNVLPSEFVGLFNSPASRRRKHFLAYKPIVETISLKTNPIGVKQALHAMKVIVSPELRLPMLFESNKKLELALKSYLKTRQKGKT